MFREGLCTGTQAEATALERQGKLQEAAAQEEAVAVPKVQPKTDIGYGSPSPII